MSRGINTMGKLNLYENIRDKLMLELLNGKFRTGDLFATDEELCARFHAGRNTVRHAVRQLVESGYLTYRRHVGICVGARYTENKPHQPDRKVLLMVPSWSYVYGYKYESLLMPVLTSGEGLSQPYEVELAAIEEFEGPDKNFSGSEDIVLAVDPGEKCIGKLRDFIASGGKVLIFHNNTELPGACFITPAGGCRSVVRYFYDLGHRNIGIICHFGGHRENWNWMTDFIKAMNEFSLPILPGAICDGRMLHEYNGESLDRVTAWLCVNRRNLNNLLEFSRKKNLKIPDDLSVICTDESGNPSLGIGNLSWDFQYLARMIDEQLNNYVPATYPLPHILDPRESTAPPRQSPKTFFS